ncbi:response regulator [Streptantibioticus rubrisoli]|uniref:Response regulator transcription factor n=1 Tax=Streptantibioticus rubrisoli TaxID=1387313 RepID=A0ABT1PDG4_9ACTN|nr:response regulator transcription factor [Streptantibioticus rubrisoli]MCQ4043407.1 response regulator transcription factor [Streptantibioticus rubrisoli]
MTVRVLLVDDEELIRAGFRMLIDSEDDLAVAGEAEDGLQAVDLTRRLLPDVVLMDIQMPGLDGIGATERISSETGLAAVRVLILTTFGEEENVFAALQAGASGFLLKDTTPGDLVSAVRTVANGDSLLSPKITRHVIEAGMTRRPRRASMRPDLAMLTERELQVLELVGRGMANEEIAEDLFISPLTVKTHVSRLLTKLHARDRAQLVVAAYEGGLLTPPT